jgi:hypothetical protein
MIALPFKRRGAKRVALAARESVPVFRNVVGSVDEKARLFGLTDPYIY